MAENEAARTRIRERAIIAAIAELNPENEEDYLKDGKPSIKALENLLGFDVSAAERDQALKTIKAEEKGASKTQSAVVTCDDVLANLRAKGKKV